VVVTFLFGMWCLAWQRMARGQGEREGEKMKPKEEEEEEKVDARDGGGGGGTSRGCRDYLRAILRLAKCSRTKRNGPMLSDKDNDCSN
jgi:hypothetical protein